MQCLGRPETLRWVTSSSDCKINHGREDGHIKSDTTWEMKVLPTHIHTADRNQKRARIADLGELEDSEYQTVSSMALRREGCFDVVMGSLGRLRVWSG
jgi:hypothetical protein